MDIPWWMRRKSGFNWLQNLKNVFFYKLTKSTKDEQRYVIWDFFFCFKLCKKVSCITKWHNESIQLPGRLFSFKFNKKLTFYKSLFCTFYKIDWKKFWYFWILVNSFILSILTWINPSNYLTKQKSIMDLHVHAPHSVFFKPTS